MPQLAPLSWALAPIIFWTILLSFSSAMWWSKTPKFTEFSAKPSTSYSHWKWNL